MSAIDVFHAHLDVCRQCREHPFALCKFGEALLLKTAEDDALEGVKKILGATPRRSTSDG